MTPKPSEQPNLPLGVQIVFDAINQQSAAAQARARILGDALAGQNFGTDPNYVVTGEHYEDYSHQQLYDYARALNTEGLQSARDLWDSQGTKISTLASEAVAKVRTRTAHGAWVGASGDALRAAVAALEKTGIQLGGVCTSVGVRLEAASYAAQATRIAVPEPEPISRPDPDDSNSSVIPGVANPATLDTEQAARAQAERQAQAAFNNIYRPGVWTSGDQVPAFTEVPKFGQDDSASGGPGGSGGSTGAPGTGLPTAETSSPPNPTDESQNNDPESSGDPSGSNDSSPNGVTSDESNSGDSGTTNQPESEQTTAATTQPGQTTGTPGTGSPGTSGPGGSAGGASGGSAGGAPGSSGPGAPLAGRSVAGPSISSPFGAAAGSAAARAARAPMMPMGGIPGAAGRGKDDETDRKSPEYLRSVSEEWTQGITAHQAVFGADAAAARPTTGSTDVASHATMYDPSAAAPATEPAMDPRTTPTGAADPAVRSAPTSANPPTEPVAPPPVSTDEVSGLLRQFSGQGPFGPAEPPPVPESESPTSEPGQEPAR
ncbi:hypothetical protein [Nocardia sp. NPDC050413]|uniref:hypothetical protein n=1 Tax=Nocardia sp. NPDC050413 TaxID=3155784 RepID=UPI0033FF7647